MTIRIVKTQAELDAALADDSVTTVDIRSERGVWLHVGHSATVRASGSATVRASDSATVRAWGSVTVRASDSATVRAWDSATVEASGSVTVRASDSATVRASGSATVRASGSATVRASGSATVEASGSATVRASGSATVRAWDSVTVRASGSATVRAWDSATVEASGSVTVRASDSATVRASGSVTVRAWDSATVRAGSHTAVHLHSGRATVQGGVLIDHVAVDLTAARAWIDYHGVSTVTADEIEYAVVYKAVRDDLRSGRGFAYPIGAIVACDFADTDECGAGLHFSPTPAQARRYDDRATRYLECRVRLDELRPITGDTYSAPKCKAPRATVVREVDIHARPLTVATTTTEA